MGGQPQVDALSPKMLASTPPVQMPLRTWDACHDFAVRRLVATLRPRNSHRTQPPTWFLLWKGFFGLRRLSSLLYFHCGQSLSLDFRGLIQRAEAVETTQDETRWYDWERYSSRQDTRMMLGGFIGTATYAGPLAEFLPSLWIGQYTHVGNGTTFGLGHYEIDVVKD